MISRKAFWSVTIAMVVLGVASGALVGNNLFAPATPAHAAWKDVFEAPSELAQGVDAIVMAQAVGVEPGRVARSANGEDVLPYQVYEFEVLRGAKGAFRGERVFVERAGGLTSKGEAIVIDVDGGDFELGKPYVLFLKQQEDGPYFYQVNHQGRYHVANGRLLSIAQDDAVASFFDGRPVSEALGLAREYASRPQM